MAKNVRSESAPRKRLGTVEALPFIQGALGRNLRAAREQARLTETELAKILDVDATVIRQCESGKAAASESFVARVLKACGLPPGWSAPRPTTRQRAKAEAVEETVSGVVEWWRARERSGADAEDYVSRLERGQFLMTGKGWAQLARLSDADAAFRAVQTQW